MDIDAQSATDYKEALPLVTQPAFDSVSCPLLLSSHILTTTPNFPTSYHFSYFVNSLKAGFPSKAATGIKCGAMQFIYRENANSVWEREPEYLSVHTLLAWGPNLKMQKSQPTLSSRLYLKI